MSEVLDNPEVQAPELTQYDRQTIWLHWLVAFLIFALWVAGQCIDLFPRGTPKIMFRSLHITVGVALGLILAYRIYWRAFNGVRLAPVNESRLAQFSFLYHKALYILIGLLIFSGLAAVWIRGDNLFELFKVPAFDPGNKALRHDVKELHEWLANGLLAAAILHIAAAFWHQFKLKDGLLRRMTF